MRLRFRLEAMDIGRIFMIDETQKPDVSYEDNDERDDSPYCDCGNFPTEEEEAFNRCHCCGKMLEP